MSQSIGFKNVSHFVVFAFALGCFLLLPVAQAVSPAPDGGYPGHNTAEGDFALANLTTGGDNTALGTFALFHNTDGNLNTATGVSALGGNTSGSENTATGVQALFSNTIGGKNTATGVNSLFTNTGDDNTATGYQALYANTNGLGNTATGMEALKSNTNGAFNTATGLSTMLNNTTGSGNTGDGVDASHGNTTGNFNIAVGYHALTGNTTGSSNIALGANAGSNLTTGDNNIDIGNGGSADESNTIRLGDAQTATFVAGIFGSNVPKGIGVVIDASGHLGAKGSSERFKTAIKPMDKASESILALRPVTFRYKKEFDPECGLQFGLIAEDVAKVNPDLVARDAAGKVYTVRYDEVSAMLLNEFLKEHRTVEELKSTVAKQQAMIAQQQKGIEDLTTRLEEQVSQIQKISAELELNKPAPRRVVDN